MKKTASSITLSDVLADFESSLSKHEAGGDKLAEQVVADGNKSDDELNEEPEKSKTAQENENSNPEFVPVSDALTKIAQEALETEKVAMTDEAGEYGKLIAQGFITELEKTAVESEAFNRGYYSTIEKIAGYSATMDQISNEAHDTTIGLIADSYQSPLFNKIANEAYDTTLNIIATSPNSPIFNKIAYESYVAAMERIGLIPNGPIQTKIAQEAYDATREIIDSMDTKTAFNLMDVSAEAYDITKDMINRGRI